MNLHIRRRIPQLAFFVGGLACVAAQADYTYTLVNYPGADSTALYGINESGKVIGNASFADGSYVNFVYDMKKGTFGAPLADSPAGVPPAGGTTLIGINNAGTIVGDMIADFNVGPDVGAIRDKKGGYTSASLPGYGLQFRGINESGLVAGFAFNDTGTTGVAYDSKRKLFTMFLPSDFTIAHGINARGDIAGSYTDANSTYAFIRSAGGGLTSFQVDGQPTRARGISDAGHIAGFFTNASGGYSSFVSSNAGATYELVIAPGATYTTAEGIDNSGVVVGIADSSGFIAVPEKGKK